MDGREIENNSCASPPSPHHTKLLFPLCHCLHLHTITHPVPKPETGETVLILLFSLSWHSISKSCGINSWLFLKYGYFLQPIWQCWILLESRVHVNHGWLISPPTLLFSGQQLIAKNPHPFPRWHRQDSWTSPCLPMTRLHTDPPNSHSLPHKGLLVPTDQPE